MILTRFSMRRWFVPGLQCTSLGGHLSASVITYFDARQDGCGAIQLLGFGSLSEFAEWSLGATSEQINGIGATLSVLLAGDES